MAKAKSQATEEAREEKEGERTRSSINVKSGVHTRRSTSNQWMLTFLVLPVSWIK